MNCPTCGAAATRNGSDNNGSQKYRCKGAPAHFWSESTGRSAGRRPTATPAASTVRVRRMREKAGT